MNGNRPKLNFNAECNRCTTYAMKRLEIYVKTMTSFALWVQEVFVGVRGAWQCRLATYQMAMPGTVRL